MNVISTSTELLVISCFDRIRAQRLSSIADRGRTVSLEALTNIHLSSTSPSSVVTGSTTAFGFIGVTTCRKTATGTSPSIPLSSAIEASSSSGVVFAASRSSILNSDAEKALAIVHEYWLEASTSTGFRGHQLTATSHGNVLDVVTWCNGRPGKPLLLLYGSLVNSLFIACTSDRQTTNTVSHVVLRTLCTECAVRVGRNDYSCTCQIRSRASITTQVDDQ